MLVVPDVDHTQRKYAEHVHGQRQQKLKEVSVIPTTDAVVYPRTVVIERLRKQHNTTASTILCSQG